jgi:hypothetical protein
VPLCACGGFCICRWLVHSPTVCNRTRCRLMTATYSHCYYPPSMPYLGVWHLMLQQMYSTCTFYSTVLAEHCTLHALSINAASLEGSVLHTAGWNLQSHGNLCRLLSAVRLYLSCAGVCPTVLGLLANPTPGRSARCPLRGIKINSSCQNLCTLRPPGVG